mgnify:CR=1 FL=1
MKPKNIFITGGTGCVGKYLLNLLLASSDATLHLLVRTASRLDSFYKNHPQIKFYSGTVDAIEKHKDLVSSCDVVVHIATSWCDNDSAMKTNCEKTLELFKIAEEGLCQKIIYFSTASILNDKNELNPEAYEVGPMYIKSKYRAHEEIEKLNYKTPIYTVYPTLVLGGDSNIYYTHISGGIKNYHRYIRFLRFFSVNGACHFIHTRDIAEIVWFLIGHNVKQRKFVLGQKRLTIKNAIQEATDACGFKNLFQIPINTKFIVFLTKIFRIKLDPWGMYCLKNSEQTYRATDPSELDLTNHFPTFRQAVEDIEGIR